MLQPTRFLFRPLELPARAADFLEGIVRAQIDRLTPWSASEAVFGCSAPAESGADSITTVIAATTRKVAMSYVQAVSGFHPAAVAVCTDVAERNAGRVKVFEQKARGHLDAARLSRALSIVLGVAAWPRCCRRRRQPISRTTWARRRASWRGRFRSVARPFAPAMTATARRSARWSGANTRCPPACIVLDALSQVLPDNTYVTELHLAGNKLQIAGITRDAPSLIPLIEQSQHFARATFYAPTTRSASDPGERFHIEARIEPKNTANP